MFTKVVDFLLTDSRFSFIDEFMQGQITHKIPFRVPHSIMEKAERSARVSGKPVEEFIKLYVASVMDSDVEHETKTPNPKKSA